MNYEYEYKISKIKYKRANVAENRRWARANRMFGNNRDEKI